MREIVIAVNVCRILLYWIFDFQDGGILTRLGVQHTHTICIFHREIDILKDVLALATRTERID